MQMNVKDITRRASKMLSERQSHLRQRGARAVERMRRRRGH
jgi:hypothetical protein